MPLTRKENTKLTKSFCTICLKGEKNFEQNLQAPNNLFRLPFNLLASQNNLQSPPTRVTRFAEFSIIGQMFALGSFNGKFKKQPKR
jgi:hypothetical protein